MAVEGHQRSPKELDGGVEALLATGTVKVSQDLVAPAHLPSVHVLQWSCHS